MMRWLGSRTGAWFTAVLAVGAVGAIWAMVAILARQPLPWLALPMAYAAVIASRSLDLRSRWALGLAAFLFAIGGTVYALVLAATDRLARMLGRGFIETAITAGPEMVAALAWARLDGVGRFVVLAAPVLALAWAARSARRTPGTNRGSTA